tara:strand:+ start:187 stop:495 length:309 start_codon:yes stop_codon:yes gene_type:complete
MQKSQKVEPASRFESMLEEVEKAPTTTATPKQSKFYPKKSNIETESMSKLNKAAILSEFNEINSNLLTSTKSMAVFGMGGIQNVRLNNSAFRASIDSAVKAE